MTTTFDRPLVQRQSADVGARLAVFLGIADSIAPMPYLLGLEPILIQGPIIALKLAAIAFVPHAAAGTPRRNSFLLVVFAIILSGTLVDAFAGTAQWRSLLRYWAFAASMFGTLLLLGKTDYRVYAKTVVALPVLGALLHIVLVHTGQIYLFYGRYFYLGNAHPNLGGEIAAVAAIAAALVLTSRWFFPVAVVLAYDCYLMQARAALLVVAMVACWRMLWSRQGLWVGALMAAALAWLSVGGGWDLVNDLLQLDDPSRGLDSGFSGRSARWATALNLFLQDPLFGVGPSYFEATGAADPHNAFLFGLAGHGAMSLLLWLSLGGALLSVARTSGRDLLILGSGVILLVFNDRFFNLNVYPFVFYVLVLCYPRTAERHPA